MNCPRCQHTLETEQFNDCNILLELDNCPACGGTWFDKDELSQVDHIIEPTFLEIRHIPNIKEQFETLKCPSCNNNPRLQKAVHPRDNKVVIDYCPYCKGIWLDKGELEAIQTENWIFIMRKILACLTCQPH